jgi:hypothetical protein
MCETNTATDYRPPMNDTTENFFKAWAEWDRQEPKPVFFRLYHDEQGLPVTYSMENLPGTYIDIDQATYSKNSYHVRVINGKLIHIDYTNVYSKLHPGDSGTPCHPQDVAVVVDTEPNIKWKKVTYEN